MPVTEVFVSLDDGGWEEAGDLEVGEVVDTLGGPMHVGSSFALPGVETVYNFEVDGSHTYFVGESGVWVHNICWKFGGFKSAAKWQNQMAKRGWTREEIT